MRIKQGDKMKKSASIAMISAAAVLWAMIGLYTDVFGKMGYTNMQIIFLRSAATVIFMGIFLFIKDKKLFTVKLKDMWIFIGMGFLSFCMFNFLYFSSIKLNNSLSMACILMYTAPIFVMLFSAVLFKEKITVKKITALVLTLLGCIFVSGGNASMTPLGLAAGLATGLGYSLYSIFGTYAINKKYSTYTATFYAFLFSMIGSFFMCDAPGAVKMCIEKPNNIFLFLSFGIVNTALPYMLYTKGLEKIEASKAVIICCIEPVVATIFSVVIFKQHFGILSFLGMISIFAAIAMLNIKIKIRTYNKQNVNI